MTNEKRVFFTYSIVLPVSGKIVILDNKRIPSFCKLTAPRPPDLLKTIGTLSLMLQIPDEEMLPRLKTGDREAIDQFCKEQFKELCLFAFKIVDHTGEAEDIAMHTIYKCWLNLHKFTSYGECKFWLYAAARNKALDYLRNRSVRNKRSKDIEKLYEAYENPYGAAQIQVQSEFEMRQLISELPPRQKEIMHMLLEEIPPKEIAKRLNISESTVYSTKAQTIEALRKRHKRSG